jgi:hypothetical protein
MARSLIPLGHEIKVKVTMAKRVLGSGYSLKALVLVLYVLGMPVTPAHADEYQDVISKAFPGFKILSRAEFEKEIQESVKSNPALITGRFDDNELEDFAALIRSETKQKSERGSEYYRGMEVVCHAGDKRQYKCQVLGQMAISLPHFWYLYRVGTGTVGCYNEDGTKTARTVKREAVGWVSPDKGSGVNIHQPDGSYLNCVTAD